MKIRSLYRKYMIQSGLLILVLLGLVFFVIYPAFNTIIDYKKRIAEENRSLENKLAMGLNAKKIKEQLDVAEKSVSVLDKVYIASGNELNLLGDLEALASSTGVSIVLKPDFNLQPVDASTKRLSLDIAASGKYNNLIQFTNSLDSAPYYYIVNSLSLKTDNNDIMFLNLSGNFFVKATTSGAIKK